MSIWKTQSNSKLLRACQAAHATAKHSRLLVGRRLLSFTGDVHGADISFTLRSTRYDRSAVGCKLRCVTATKRGVKRRELGGEKTAKPSCRHLRPLEIYERKVLTVCCRLRLSFALIFDWLWSFFCLRALLPTRNVAHNCWKFISYV